MTTSKKITQLAQRSHRFLYIHEYWMIEIMVALFLFFTLSSYFPFPVPSIAAWDGFALTSILITWLTIFTKDPYEIRRQLRLKDTTRRLLFVVVLLAAIVSFLATWLLLVSAKKSPTLHTSETIALSIATVAISWFFVHTRFAILYAHAYYRDAIEQEREKTAGGLLFPGRELPNYLDFVYFSFVIGMTCQVADVGISRHQLRRFVLLHGLIAFLFNTAILALMINIIAGLL